MAPRTKRVEMPVPETGEPSAALVELTGGGTRHVMPRLVQIPLTELHPHPRNPRQDLGDLEELAASIKSHGIRQPLTVVPHTAAGGHGNHSGYLVVIGHRRAAAAQEAELESVPALVDESLTEAQQLELMLVENVQRADLSPVEEASGYQGLLDLGLDVEAIVSKTGRSASTVRRRLQLVALPKSARDKVHFHQGTLGDAELLAETIARPDIAARPDVVAELIEAYGSTGARFAGLVKSHVQDVELAESQAKLTAELQAKGIRVIPAPSYDDKKIKALTGLTDEDRQYGASIDKKRHAKCPGHVAWMSWEWKSSIKAPVAVYGCDDFRGNGHHDRYAQRSSATEKPSIEERRLVRANNKAWAAATAARREWIRTVLLVGAPPEGLMTYLGSLIDTGHVASYHESSIYSELVAGKRERGAAPAPVITETLAWRHLVAVAAAIAEIRLDSNDSWRNKGPLPVAHMRFLVTNGFEATELEQAFVDTDLSHVTVAGQPAETTFDKGSAS